MWRALQLILITMAVAGGLVLGCGERPGEREFQNGVRQFERGNLVRAKDLFEKSVNKRPGHEGNAYAYQYLGYIAWRLDDPTAAVANFETSRRLHPQLFEPVYSLAVIAFDEGDYSRARSLFSEAAQLKLDDPRPFEYIAHTHADEAGRRDARRILYQALSRAPQSPRILTSLALVELEDNGPAAAVSYLMQALENNPDYPPALFNLGRIYADWPEQEDHAIEYYNQYLAVAPESEQRTRARRALARLMRQPTADDEIATPAPETPPEDPPAPRPRSLDDILEEAQDLADTGQTEQAVSLCLRAAIQAGQQQRTDQEERALYKAVALGPNVARAHVALGRHLAARDRHAEALRAYQRAVELESDWTHALIGLAASAEALSNYDVALDALNKAVALEPNDPGPLWSLAQLYDETGVRRRAIEAYERFRRTFAGDPRANRAEERMAALQPREPAATPQDTVAAPTPAPRLTARDRQAAIDAFNRGATYQQRREWDSALFFYERALQLDPSLERAHYNKGLIQLERRNLREARDAFARSAELDPNKVTTRYNLALVYYEMEEPRSALPHLDAVVRADPNFAPAHLLLGLIFSAEPRTHDRAKRHYTRFLDLRPNDPGAAAIRDWIARN